MRSRWLQLLALTLGVFFATPAQAQLFSPGKLAKGHEDLEGLKNCTQCHPQGGKLTEERCLDCHTELKGRVAKQQGYHGRLEPAKRACQRCHHDHKGVAYQMIRWDEKTFDHKETGWLLSGAHAKAECKTCHEPRLIVDKEVKKRLANKNKKRTFLGLADRCRDCHFDEHRGQVSKKCETCHSEDKFKPAKGFDHAKSAFALKGKHSKVDCDKCHELQTDTKTPAGAFPAPVSNQFSHYSPIEHKQCTNCHDDPHRGQFGKRCEDCHSEQGWNKIKAKKRGKRDFHDSTRYPLEAAHTEVDCDACHLPLGKRKKVFRGLPFKRCDDCHLDAHQGQVEGDCSVCHDLNGFQPANFGDDAHAKTEYALQGAHLAVACARCHVDATQTPTPSPALERYLKRSKRTYLISPQVLDLKARRCLECHTDAHEGQLEHRVQAEGCEGCHNVQGWEKVRLDHDKDTRYPLTGKHSEAACQKCHLAPTPKAAVVYRPLETACADCHPDVHMGQLADAKGTTDCTRCHDTADFKVLQGFSHEASRFPLRGKHEAVDCNKCHLEVQTKGGTLRKYRALPVDCEGCHADYHKGAFRRFIVPTEGLAVAATPVASAGAGCAECHGVEGWAPAQFDHARVGWQLQGRHAEARCGSCHGSDLSRPLSRDCSACHQDPHRGDLGQRCESCHDQAPSGSAVGAGEGNRPWASRYDADAHLASTFPLAGAHAAIACEECHSDTFGRGFVRAAGACLKCHADDYDSAAITSIDHVQAGFDQECQRCHVPSTFQGGRFEAHDACFYLSAGPHAAITCSGCHDSLQGATVSGRCDTQTARCTSCHEHSQDETDPEHREVPGYEYKDQKCYECHKFAQR